MWRFRLWFWFSAAALCCAQNADLQQRFERALALQRSGDLDAAIGAYRERPELGALHLNLGAALAAAGRYEEAAAEYRSLLQVGENASARLNLGLALYKSGELAGAAEQFAKVRALQPGNAQALVLEADCDLRLGNYKHAIQLLSPQAASQDPARDYILGTALIRDGQRSAGQATLDRLLQHGETAGTNLLQAEAALADEDYPGARAHTRRALELDPKLPDAYTLDGIAREGLGDYAGARGTFERAVELDPHAFDADLHLAALAVREGDADSANRFVAAALRLRPGSAAAKYQEGMILKSQGKAEDAAQAFEAAAKSAPEWLEPHVQLASLYYRLKRPADGLRERGIVDRLTRLDHR